MIEKPIPEPGQSEARRIIKVSRTFQHRVGNKLVPRPMIRLSGKWLEEAGFPVGGLVEVRVHSGEMRLTVRNRLEQ